MNGASAGILARLVNFSIRFRGVIIALAVCLLGYGFYTLVHARYGVFPEFAPPQVVIQTEAPGLSPEEVEALVTRPIESVINGVSGIESLRSGSIQGLSVITVVFATGSDIYLDRQVVAERLATLSSRLPEGIQPPVMNPLTTSTSVVMVLGLTSKTRSLMELRTFADWLLKQRLLAVPGVAKVAVYGGEVRQLQVQVDPERLTRWDLDIGEVEAAARRATGVRGSGFISSANQRIPIQTRAQSTAAPELARTLLLHKDGAAVTLGDVADVTEAPEPPIGAAAIMGHPGVMLVVSGQYGANVLALTQRIDGALADLQAAFRAKRIRLHDDIFRPANFVLTAVRNMRRSMLMGGILVVGTLLLFLFDMRTAAISCTAIPLSLLGAVTVLQKLGISLNTLTLGGLAIAIGEVVDDAVIDVENILRRLRENRSRPDPQPAFRVVFQASLEVRSAVVYATFAVALVFLPILAMGGLAGRLFSPLALAYVAATLFSLLVALTVTPALSLLLLEHHDLAQSEPPLVRWLKQRYRLLLERLGRRPGALLAAAALLTIAGLSILPFFGGEFLPELREGHFIIHMSALPGTSLKESLRLGERVTRDLLRLPFVHLVAQRAGRAEKGDDILGTHDSELEVDLKPLSGEAADRAEARIRAVLARFPGAVFSLKTFLSERIEETLSGYTASVVVNVYGEDLDLLDSRARQAARLLERVPGATGVQIQSPPAVPQVVIKLRRKDLLRWGFSPVEVLAAVGTGYRGETVGRVYDSNRVFDVSVILEPRSRRSVAAVASLPLRNGSGTYVRLSQVADIFETTGRYAVLHRGARRVQTITCNVAGRDVASFAAEARHRLRRDISLPAGYYLEFTGAAEAQARSRRDLLVHSLLAGVGVILLLSVVMANYRNLLLVLVNLPFALVGGAVAVFVSGGWLSIGSLVGFVTLFGITLRNSIMMISHFEHLVAVEGMTWGKEAALRGASERLAPILMTALVTAVGLAPLALGSGAPGREIEGPMAQVILGGLITSTSLNLLALPALALRFGVFQKRAEPS